MAKVNSTHSILTGGYPTWTRSWLFEWTSGAWTESGKLNEGRWNHGCAVLKGQGVLVAGGVNEDNDDAYSVELYDPETGIWTLQPGLPKNPNMYPYHPTLLPWSDTVIALFKGVNEVFQREEDGTWSVLE